MEWKAELQPGRAVSPIPTPVSLPSSPGLWVGLFKVIVISRVGPQLGEASGSFHLSGYNGFRDRCMSYGGVAGGHLRTLGSMCAAGGRGGSSPGPAEGPTLRCRRFYHGDGQRARGDRNVASLHILKTGLRSPCLWAGLLHEPINPPSCSPRLQLGFSSLSAVGLAPRRLRGCCRRGPSLGPVKAGGPGSERLSNRPLVPWAPLWGRDLASGLSGSKRQPSASQTRDPGLPGGHA